MLLPFVGGGVGRGGGPRLVGLVLRGGVLVAVHALEEKVAVFWCWGV